MTIRDLVRHALRHRPDHIVVGEVRGGEAADLLQALNTGHGGSLTTIHANNAESALSRLASCAMQGGGDLPWEVICRSVVDGISMVIHMTRREGRRYVEEALHVGDYDITKRRWPLPARGLPVFTRHTGRGKAMMTTDKRLRKKRAARIGGLMCFGGIIALAMAGQWAGPITARVERVVDGDTLVVRYQGESHTVRLIGVHTPESVHPTEPVEPFGAEASAFTRARLDGKTVELAVDPAGDTVDAYGRLLRLVYLEGENFNATLIALENQARIQGRGLWAPRLAG